MEDIREERTLMIWDEENIYLCCTVCEGGREGGREGGKEGRRERGKERDNWRLAASTQP